MALSVFPQTFTQSAADLIALNTVIQYVYTSSGDLLFRDLNNIQNALRTAKVSAIAALTEAQKQPTAAETFMASMGGPTTILAYQTQLVDVEAKAAAWNAALTNALATLTSSDLISVVDYTQDGITTKMIQNKNFIPALVADPLRQNQAFIDLANMIEAIVS